MKLKYIILTIIILVIIAVIALFVFGDRWAEHKLQTKLDEIENLTYDSLNIELEKNKIAFSGLMYDKEGLSVSIPRIIIEDINIYKIIFQNTLHIQLLTLDSTKVTYEQQEMDSTSSINTADRSLKVEIDEIEITNAALVTYRKQAKEPYFSTDFNLKLNDVKLQQLEKAMNLTQPLSFLNLYNITYRTESGRYTINTAAVNYSKESSSFLIKSLTVVPQYEKYKFAHVVGHEVDHMNVSIDSILVEVDSLNEAIKDKHVNKVYIHHPRLEIFRDKRLPFPDNQRPKLLKELLAAEESNFALDSIFIINGDIVYEEHVKEAESPGKVIFNELNGLIVNLYTYNKNFSERPRLTASCKLFDTTTLYADISFPNTLSESTIVKGKVEPVDLTVFNQMLEHVAFTRIKSGQLNRLDFDFSYYRTNSKGEMRFDYNNLHVEFLKKETNESGGFFNEMKEFVANTFVVNSNNGTNGKIRIGDIDFERNMKKSMFNLWWKSILSGFKSSTGIKPSEKRSEKNNPE